MHQEIKLGMQVQIQLELELKLYYHPTFKQGEIGMPTWEFDLELQSGNLGEKKIPSEVMAPEFEWIPPFL